jgi:hypothetical protein
MTIQTTDAGKKVIKLIPKRAKARRRRARREQELSPLERAVDEYRKAYFALGRLQEHLEELSDAERLRFLGEMAWCHKSDNPMFILGALISDSFDLRSWK